VKHLTSRSCHDGSLPASLRDGQPEPNFFGFDAAYRTAGDASTTSAGSEDAERLRGKPGLDKCLAR
jgi:hypothetical protein